jgi:hypothetical protein
MKGLFIAVLLVVSAAFLVLPRCSADAEGDKVPTIKEIMEKAHRCRTAYIKLVREELVKADPNWPVVENKSKEMVQMGHWLAKNTPPRGSKESWEKFTSLYVAHATILTDAAERKDKETALVHQKKLSAMCATCHREHRGR